MVSSPLPEIREQEGTSEGRRDSDLTVYLSIFHTGLCLTDCAYCNTDSEACGQDSVSDYYIIGLVLPVAACNTHVDDTHVSKSRLIPILHSYLPKLTFASFNSPMYQVTACLKLHSKTDISPRTWNTLHERGSNSSPNNHITRKTPICQMDHRRSRFWPIITISVDVTHCHQYIKRWSA